jgi:hypothetical protein
MVLVTEEESASEEQTAMQKALLTAQSAVESDQESADQLHVAELYALASEHLTEALRLGEVDPNTSEGRTVRERATAYSERATALRSLHRNPRQNQRRNQRICGGANSSSVGSSPPVQLVRQAGNAQLNDTCRRAGTSSTFVGAGAAGAAVGACVAGLPLALAGGAGAAYMSTRDDSYGDFFRSTGKSVASTYKSAKSFEKKHQLGSRVKAASSKACNDARDFSEKHKIGMRMQKAVSTTHNQISSWAERNQVGERIANATHRAAENASNCLDSYTNSSSRQQRGANSLRRSSC